MLLNNAKTLYKQAFVKGFSVCTEGAFVISLILSLPKLLIYHFLFA
jgi:hypothetical protein